MLQLRHMPRTIFLTGEPKSTQHIYKFATRPFPKMCMMAEGKATKAGRRRASGSVSLSSVL